jgi:hypothetical protein
MASNIQKSVGRGGVNREADVNVVKALLNEQLDNLRRSTPLPLDGDADDATINAIEQFQRNVVGMTPPDGRVDPGGSTIRALRASDTTFVQLPAGGDGFYAYGQAAKRWGTSRTLASVRKAAKAFHGKFGIPVGVGNISLRDGGRIPPHVSHRRGVDVDFRPLRSDGEAQPVTIANPAYDRERTRALVKILREDPNLKMILFNDTAIAGVQQWAGHDNHLHVRFDV